MPGRPLDDSDRDQMTLHSRHRIQNSSHDSLRSSRVPKILNFHEWAGKKHSFEIWIQDKSWGRLRELRRIRRQRVVTVAPPPSEHKKIYGICTMTAQHLRRWYNIVQNVIQMFCAFQLTNNQSSAPYSPCSVPQNTGRFPYAELMLAHRLQRWANNNPA